MAYFDKDRGVVLTPDDKDLDRERNQELQTKQNPTVDRIMKFILGDTNI